MGAIVDALKTFPLLNIGIEVELRGPDLDDYHTHIQDVEYVTRRFRIDPYSGDEEEVEHDYDSVEEEVECTDPDCEDGDGITQGKLRLLERIAGILEAKRDGSLSDGDLEIVTEWGSVAEWATWIEDGLDVALAEADDMGACAEPSSQTGIHIHASIQNMQMARVPEAFLRILWEEARQFDWKSVRHANRYGWARDVDDTFEGFIAHRHSGYSGRYRAVNLQSLDSHGTIEFRAFDSSMSMNQIAEYVSIVTEIMQRTWERYRDMVMQAGNLEQEIADAEKAATVADARRHVLALVPIRDRDNAWDMEYAQLTQTYREMSARQRELTEIAQAQKEFLLTWTEADENALRAATEEREALHRQLNEISGGWSQWGDAQWQRRAETIRAYNQAEERVARLTARRNAVEALKNTENQEAM